MTFVTFQSVFHAQSLKEHPLISGLGGPQEVPLKSDLGLENMDNYETLPMDVMELPTPQPPVARKRPPSFQDADTRRKNYQNVTSLKYKDQKQTSPASGSTRTPDAPITSSPTSDEPSMPPRRVRSKSAPELETKPDSADVPAGNVEVLGMELGRFLFL